MDSILNFASKRKRPIAGFVATVAIMAGVAAATWDEHKSALESDVGKVWACAEVVSHPSNSDDIAHQVKDAKDSVDSCRQTEKWAAEHRHLLQRLRWSRYLH